MYKATVRAMIRRNIRLLNEGRYEPALAMFASDATLTFPGDNSWSRMYREPQTGTESSPTHRGRAEIEAFLRRYVSAGIQMEVEDILVNGAPWNTRAALIVHDWALDADGNRGLRESRGARRAQPVGADRHAGRLRGHRTRGGV